MIHNPSEATATRPENSPPPSPPRKENPGKIRGRPDDRLREIRAALLARIHTGEWKPGGRIPTRRDLSAEFSASPVTIQQALDTLNQDGFTRSDGRNGTFVVETPPHRVNIALVFPEAPTKNRLWLALFREAMAPRPDGLRLMPRCDINVNADGCVGAPDQIGLVEDIRRRRLLGIFFASSPHLVANTHIVSEPGIPRCAVMTSGKFPEIPKIGFDGESFKTKALEFLKSKGRLRVAVIGGPDIVKSDWLERIAAMGLESGAHWLQGVSIHDSLSGVNLARLIFHGSSGEHPDALVIADDNLVEHVTAGVAQSDVNIPQELDIVAHCNFPCPPPAAVPVRRLGYDAGQILEAGVQALLTQQRGEEPMPHKTMPAIFDDELSRRR